MIRTEHCRQPSAFSRQHFPKPDARRRRPLHNSYFIVLTSLLFSFLFSLSASADGPPCLPDSNGDGHPIFGNPEYRLGNFSAHPLSLAMGDLDGDGDIDLAIVNNGRVNIPPAGHDEVVIYLNHGDGLFVGPPRTSWDIPINYGDDGRYEAGEEPRAVALGDLDGDGDLDLAVAAAFSDAAFVLLNNGDGSFVDAVPYPVGDQPRSVAVGDVDSDGDLDLTVLNAHTNNISVLLGNGDGTFATQATYDVGVVGDNPDSGAEVPVGGIAHVLADLDGDGDLDLGVANGGGFGSPGSTVSVLLNNGDGTFASRVPYDVGLRPLSLAAGDVDGDGDLDLVTANERSGDVSVLLNNGDATFASHMTYDADGLPVPQPGWLPGAMPRSVALADIDNDGDADLAVGHLLNTEVSVLPGNGDGTFDDEVVYQVDLQPLFVDFADLNADGGLDLAVLSYAWGREKLSIIFNFGDGLFLNDEKIDAVELVKELAAGDLDGDGDLDLVMGHADSNGLIDGDLYVLLNNGNGTFAAPVQYGAVGPWSVAIVDLDGDGDLDLAAANTENFAGDSVSVLLNNGDGTFALGADYAVGSAPLFVTVGDVDGDGDQDLVTADLGTSGDAGGTGFVSVLLNNGDGTFAAPTAYNVLRTPRQVALGDLDGDGDLDLVVAHQQQPSDLQLVMFNNGDGTFGLGVPYATGFDTGAMSVVVDDLDSDGDLDLVFGLHRAFESGGAPDVAVLLNSGNGTFLDGGTYFIPQIWQTGSLGIADLDGDGTLDLVLGSGNGLAVVPGHGDGTFAFDDPFFYGREHGNASVVVGDFDGDGDLDLAVGNGANPIISILFDRACEPQPCPADLDGNGEVGAFDLALLLGNWGPCDGDCPADLDGSGAVGAFDLALLLGNWGDCP